MCKNCVKTSTWILQLWSTVWFLRSHELPVIWLQEGDGQTTRKHNASSIVWRHKRLREVRGTYPAVMSEEDGVTLDVSVDHTLCVEDRQRLQDRQTHCSYLFLVHPGEGRRHQTDMSVWAHHLYFSHCIGTVFFWFILHSGMIISEAIVMMCSTHKDQKKAGASQLKEHGKVLHQLINNLLEWKCMWMWSGIGNGGISPCAEHMDDTAPLWKKRVSVGFSEGNLKQDTE